MSVLLRSTVTLLATLLIAAASTLVGGLSASAAATPRIPTRSFCAYGEQGVQQVREFESLLTGKVDCALLFNDKTSNWQAWDTPWFLSAHAANANLDWEKWVKADSSRRLVLSQSFAPSSNMPSDWLHRAALGQYDGYAVALARNLVNAGLGNTIIRLSHEANGWWFSHSVPETSAGKADWRAAWVRMVRAMRTVPGANFVFDWCINYRTWGQGRNIWIDDFYPGDAYVDIIGLDAYDENTTLTTGRWNFQMTREGGIQDVYDFALSRGKPISFPEWGMLPWGGPMKGGGDSPGYMAGMGNFIATRNVAYSSYWYTTDSAIVLQTSKQGMGYFRQFFGKNGPARNQTACADFCPALDNR